MNYGAGKTQKQQTGNWSKVMSFGGRNLFQTKSGKLIRNSSDVE